MRRIWTKEELETVFRINEAGELERLCQGSRWGRDWRIVDCVDNSQGYCVVSFKGTMIKYHTIIWILMNGSIEDVEVELDHIDGNRVNNRIENLRLVSKRENNQNTHKHRNGRLVGCHLHKCGKWQALVVINGKLIHLGYYSTEAEAHQIYCEALTMLDKSVEEIQEHFNVSQFSSKYNNVSYNKQRNKWEAGIRINGKKIHLGRYTTELEAHQSYCKALELIGQYVDNKQFRNLIEKGAL